MSAAALLLGARLGADRFTAVVDRIEGDFAVLELHDATLVDVPRGLLPAPVCEGDRLRVRLSRRGLRLRLRPPSPHRSARPRASTTRTCAHPQGE